MRGLGDSFYTYSILLPYWIWAAWGEDLVVPLGEIPRDASKQQWRWGVKKEAVSVISLFVCSGSSITQVQSRPAIETWG